MWKKFARSIRIITTCLSLIMLCGYLLGIGNNPPHRSPSATPDKLQTITSSAGFNQLDAVARTGDREGRPKASEETEPGCGTLTFCLFYTVVCMLLSLVAIRSGLNGPAAFFTCLLLTPVFGLFVMACWEAQLQKATGSNSKE